jgi:hypothetical protein
VPKALACPAEQAMRQCCVLLLAASSRKHRVNGLYFPYEGYRGRGQQARRRHGRFGHGIPRSNVTRSGLLLNAISTRPSPLISPIASAHARISLAKGSAVRDGKSSNVRRSNCSVSATTCPFSLPLSAAWGCFGRMRRLRLRVQPEHVLEPVARFRRTRTPNA